MAGRGYLSEERQERLKHQLQALTGEFAAALPERITQLTGEWAEGLRAGGDGETARALRLGLHNLKGSAAGYGFAAIADLAAKIEAIIARHAEKGDALSATEKADIDHMLIELAGQAAGAARGVPPLPVHQVTAGDPETYADSAHHLFSYGVDAALAQQVMNFGFELSAFDTVDPLLRVMLRDRPGAVLVDGRGPDAGAALKVIGEACSLGRPPIPLLVLGNSGGVHERLEAVRAGARAFLPAPIDTGDLLAELDRLTQPVAAAKPQVLIIDDEPQWAEYHASVLRAAGMETHIQSDPLAALDDIKHFDPDLVLLDLYMAGCSGEELAAMIRQHPQYASLPIVYLSAEQRIERQMDAITSGADDFIAKPVAPDRLISSVLSRVERRRLLKMLMTQDAMTRLLNHTATKERIAAELSRARRLASPLSVAMIDLDHFKVVNDTHGHAQGDAVIRTLARLLRQRLRIADSIGRYGGEEFVVVLPDTPADRADDVLDKLRQIFCQTQFGAGANRFKVSFSAGIASFPPEREGSADLLEAADQALYAAKREGRNRVKRAH